MDGIITRIRRIFLSIISFGLIKHENPAVIAPYLIESMRDKLSEIKRSAVPVIANQYRIERLLEAESAHQQKLHNETIEAVRAGDDALATDLILQKEAVLAREEELRTQLTQARDDAAQAKEEIARFQDELTTAEARARSVQMRYQLASMRTQVQKFGITPAMDDDMKALSRIEEQVDTVEAEAQALLDISGREGEQKLWKLHQTARKERAQATLAELKSEMGLTETEKRFQRVEITREDKSGEEAA